MTFTTLTFVLFLAATFSLYWSIRNRSAQNLLLVIASFSFYAWWDYRFSLLLMAATLVDFFVSIGLDVDRHQSTRRLLLGISLLANLGMLGFFKYWNFFVDSIQSFAESLGWHMDEPTLRVILPIGISFYTFQTLSYMLDVYAGKIRATRSLLDYMAYISFFPQLVAGPIERARHLLVQMQNPRRFDAEEATDGCRQILWGFFKKLVIADRLGALVDSVYGTGIETAFDRFSGPQIAFATVAASFQIYCDFSAYSDIAIGTAKLFGIRLSRNFAYPFFAQSMGELWRRWHITLMAWFRDYVFFPLGGVWKNRALVVRNVMLTFMLIGLWHGAGWNFILWGAFMGLVVLREPLTVRGGGRRGKRVSFDLPGGPDRLPSFSALRKILLTFSIFSLVGVLFRSPNLASSIVAYQKIISDLLSIDAFVSLGHMMASKDGRNAWLCMLLIVVIEWVQRRKPHPMEIGNRPRWQRWLVYSVILWMTILAMPRHQGQFIYFQF